MILQSVIRAVHRLLTVAAIYLIASLTFGYLLAYRGWAPVEAGFLVGLVWTVALCSLERNIKRE